MDIREQILLACATALPELKKPQDRLDALTTIVSVATEISQTVYDRHPLNSYKFLAKSGIVKNVDVHALAKQIRRRSKGAKR